MSKRNGTRKCLQNYSPSSQERRVMDRIEEIRGFHKNKYTNREKYRSHITFLLAAIDRLTKEVEGLNKQVWHTVPHPYINPDTDEQEGYVLGVTFQEAYAATLKDVEGLTAKLEKAEKEIETLQFQVENIKIDKEKAEAREQT